MALSSATLVTLSASPFETQADESTEPRAAPAGAWLPAGADSLTGLAEGDFHSPAFSEDPDHCFGRGGRWQRRRSLYHRLGGLSLRRSRRLGRRRSPFPQPHPSAGREL